MNCICLQIIDRTIRKAEMVWSSGRWSCVESDSRQLASDDAVSDPLSYPELADAVRELLSGIKSKPVSISISSSDILLKWIELPDAIPQVDAQLQDQAIKTLLENETYIPIALDEAAYDFQLLSPTTLLIGWMRKRGLASFIKALSGVELVYLSPQPVTVANQLLPYGPERMCGVHVDGSMCDLAVVDSGELCLGRSFFFGDPAQLLRTIRQSLANCPNPTGNPLKRIVLLNSTASSESPPPWQGGARGGLVTGHWSQVTGTAVEVTESTFDWHTALLKPIQWQMVSKKHFTGHWSQATGTSFRLNLLAPVLAERAAQQKLKKKRQLMQAIPIAAMLMLAGANVKLYDWVGSKHAHIDGLRADHAEVKRLQAETKSLGEQYAAHEKALTQLAWGESHLPPLAERLILIANRSPASIRLMEIKTVAQPQSTKARADFDARKVLMVTGVAPSQAEINVFRAALVTQAQFSSVRQVKTEPTLVSDERWLEFTLALSSAEGV